MKVNIYYGGRGILDDPTLYVLQKIEEVLRELRVTVERFNIYEMKNNIPSLPQTLKDADGIILATTVEWLGIGGYMQQFLDACWLYGDKEKIAQTYMQPIVMSQTYGERESELTLKNAWEILGGLPCSGICGYVEDLVTFEMNKDYNLLIEKTAENLYRTISQKIRSLPCSNQAVKRTVSRSNQMDMTPEESEQLSHYVSDENYVQTRKEDLEELTSIFRDMMGKSEGEEETPYILEFQSHFVPVEELEATYLFVIEEQQKPLIVDLHGKDLTVRYGGNEQADVYAKLKKATMDDIVSGRKTFQRAFMAGEMTARGDFKTLRMLDEAFDFQRKE
ncbi:MAG: SCP2 sterol-binding domain-containing protein [Lachnospiraceae bacterium]|nr:SCP2 sterol-binding domain-containing protein [Lachnospiraceae bacterium]